MKRWFWALDLAVIMSFAVIGLDFHGKSGVIASVFRVATPFLIALAVGMAIASRFWKSLSPLYGLVVGVTTLALGMVIRANLWNEGTATSFVVVSGIWFIGWMVGWRLVGVGITWSRNRGSLPASH